MKQYQRRRNRQHQQQHRQSLIKTGVILALLRQGIIFVLVIGGGSRISNNVAVDAYTCQTNLISIRRHNTNIYQPPKYHLHSNTDQIFQRSLLPIAVSLSTSRSKLQSLPIVEVWDEPLITTSSFWSTICSSLLSATISYFSLIVYYDRPRGQLHIDVDEQIRVRPSIIIPNGGLGAYCNVPMIPKDTILGTYPGVVIPIQYGSNKLQQYPFCEAYIWRFSDNQYIIDPTNTYGTLDDICYGGNPNMIPSLWFHQTIIPFIIKLLPTGTSSNNNPFMKSTILCRINEPPIGYDVNVYTIENIHDRTVSFITERDIYYNEELFIDYGLNYDRSNYAL
jgi:hypothetical protein